MRNEETKDIDIRAIETSCDETAAAVVRNGREVLSNIIYTQIKLHTVFGGVVPEIASRKHMEKINLLTRCHTPSFDSEKLFRTTEFSRVFFSNQYRNQ